MKPKLRLNIETKVQNLKKKQILKILNYTSYVIYDCKNFFS